MSCTGLHTGLFVISPNKHKFVTTNVRTCNIATLVLYTNKFELTHGKKMLKNCVYYAGRIKPETCTASSWVNGVVSVLKREWLERMRGCGKQGVRLYVLNVNVRACWGVLGKQRNNGFRCW